MYCRAHLLFLAWNEIIADTYMAAANNIVFSSSWKTKQAISRPRAGYTNGQIMWPLIRPPLLYFQSRWSGFSHSCLALLQGLLYWLLISPGQEKRWAWFGCCFSASSISLVPFLAIRPSSHIPSFRVSGRSSFLMLLVVLSSISSFGKSTSAYKQSTVQNLFGFPLLFVLSWSEWHWLAGMSLIIFTTSFRIRRGNWTNPKTILMQPSIRFADNDECVLLNFQLTISAIAGIIKITSRSQSPPCKNIWIPFVNHCILRSQGSGNWFRCGTLWNGRIVHFCKSVQKVCNDKMIIDWLLTI